VYVFCCETFPNTSICSFDLLLEQSWGIWQNLWRRFGIIEVDKRVEFSSLVGFAMEGIFCGSLWKSGIKNEERYWNWRKDSRSYWQRKYFL